MAGDWIKMETSLWDHPKVSRLVEILDESEALVIGGLFRFWSIADQHSEDGKILSMTAKTVDRKTGIAGFADALVIVGWLAIGDDFIEVPDWDDHHSASAKKRSNDARRQSEKRKKSASQVANNEHPSQSVAKKSHEKRLNGDLEKRREEKRREEERERTSGSAPEIEINAIEIPPCTIEQAKASAAISGIAPDAAEMWWHDRDSLGWQHRGQSIRNWQSNLVAYGRRWAENENKNKLRSNGSNRSNSKAGATSRNDGTLNNPAEYQ